MRLLLSLVVVAGLGSALAQEPPPPLPALTREQVQQAVQQLKQDPNLTGTRAQKTLQFIKKDEPAKPSQPLQLWSWLRNLFAWLADVSRLLVWGLGIVLVAVGLVGLRHWLHWRSSAVHGPAAELPSHVRDLDIRRESLPADIGAAAQALWDQGQARPALSLLYRGSLSRLVHTHAVPIRASSTEQECVQLARRALGPDRSDFVARLVQAWLLTVYGLRRPADAEVRALCTGFHAQLDAPAGLHQPPLSAAVA